MYRAVFLDRDGVIVEFVELLHKPEQLKLKKGSAEAIRLFNNSNLKTIIISNQPVIARGMITEKELAEIDEKLKKMLRREYAVVDKSYYCPHHPDANIKEYRKLCSCRKPAPGLILRAAKDLNINLKQSWMIGDSLSDIVAGKRAGCKTVLIDSLLNKELIIGMENINIDQIRPDYRCKNLLEAAKLILK